MHTIGMQYRVLCRGLLDDPGTFLDGERCIDFVLEPQDFPTVVLVPDPAFERNVAATGIVGE